MNDFKSILRGVIDRYPAGVAHGQRDQIDRMAFELSLFVPFVPPGGRVADLGGGWGTVALGAAAAGLRAVLVDDYRDPGFCEADITAMRALYADYGVEAISRDLVHQGLDFPAESFDAITTFDSIEHWHGSPKRALHDAMHALRPGGRLIVATPNCVNLRKRITVPLGRGKWTSMDDWYEQETFRSHVREPDVDDLDYIARDIGLRDYRIIGRNWSGHGSPRLFVRQLTRVADRMLQMRPSLCSELYLIGNRAPRNATPDAQR